MFKFKVSYTSYNEIDVWASTPSDADAIIQTKPNYYSTLGITNLGPFEFSVGQTVYMFETVPDAIISGIVTDINYLTATEVRVFVRFTGEASARMFFWPTDTAKLYTNLNDLIAYLGRELATPAPPVTLPIPSGLSSTSVTTTSFILNWYAVSNATGYNVYKNGALLYANAQGTVALVSALVPNTSYAMEVSALGANGETNRSTPLSVVTLAQLASIPNGVTASLITDDGFRLDWNISVGAVTYNIYLNNVLHTTGIVGQFSVLAGLLPNTAYQVQMTAVNTGGESAKSVMFTVDTAPPLPDAPTGLGGSDITQTTLELSWNFVAGADSYNIYKDDMLEDSTTSTVFPVFGLAPDTSYNFEVSAVNTTGESDRTPILQLTTLV